MADMVTLPVRLTPPQYRAFLESQQVPAKRIEQVMQQIQVQDGLVVGVPSQDLAPPASYVPAGVQEPDPSKLGKLAGKAKHKLGELKAKINEKINDAARDAARDQGFGVSVLDIQAKVIPSEMDPDTVTIRTVIKLDSSDLDLQFNGSGGKLLPQGGYTVTVDLPYQYQTDADDNIIDVAKQEYDRIRAELKEAYRAVTYNPERDADKLPPPGTTITRHLLVGFKGNYALENLGVNGEATTQFTVQHRFGKNGKIQLSVSENRLRKVGGRPHFTINDLSLHGGATVQKQAERGVQLEVDVIRPGNDDQTKRREMADRKLLSETVRFDDKGLPQLINYDAAAKRSRAVRTARLAKQLDGSGGASYSFGAAGLSTSYGKLLQSVYQSRHTDANREEADQNLATWVQAVEAEDGTALMGELRRASGVEGATFNATARNDDAVALAAKLGKTFGTSHVRLEVAARFGERMKDCNTIKRTLQMAPDGKTSTFTYDALDGKQFVTTLMDFDAGLKVQPSLKNKIREYTDDIVGQVEDSFSAGKWLENLDLKEKVGDAAYDIIKENVEKIALSFDATHTQASWGRIILKASKIPSGATHDALVGQMMQGDFRGVVAAGLPLTTNTIEKKTFKAKVDFDFAGLLSYAMERSQGVIDEKKVWEFDGKKFTITEMKGEVSKKVKSINETNFQLKSYYVTSVGDDGEPIEGVPTQAITTIVYTSKEANVARDKEAGRLVGMAEALKFDTFVAFQPEEATGFGAGFLRIFRGIHTLRDGTISIATATSTQGHVDAINRTADEAQAMGEATARSILRMGEELTPTLAAQTFNPCGDLAKSQKLAEFINAHFWGHNSLTSGFPGAAGWNNRIDADEVVKIRRNFQKWLDEPPKALAGEIKEVKALLPEGGLGALPDRFIMTAGASAILRDGLQELEDEPDEPSASRATYARTYGREIDEELFIREMGQFARGVAEHPNVIAMRARLAKGEIPSDEEVHALLVDFIALAAENTQGSTAIFSDEKELYSLARQTILQVMAGEENVLGMVNVNAELGDFAAGSSPDLTPAAINAKRTRLVNEVANQKNQLEQQTHGP